MNNVKLTRRQLLGAGVAALGGLAAWAVLPKGQTAPPPNPIPAPQVTAGATPFSALPTATSPIANIGKADLLDGGDAPLLDGAGSPLAA